MRRIILALFLLIPMVLVSQQIQKVTNNETNETYHVLKSNIDIRHGEYQKRSQKNTLLVKGFFKNGLKDSIWESYNEQKELLLKYNHSTNQLLFQIQKEKKMYMEYRVVSDSAGADTVLSHHPVILGGESYLMRNINENLKIPSTAIESGITGMSIVKVTIDKFGKITGYTLVKKYGFGIDEQVLELIKKKLEVLAPGRVNNQPVNSEFYFKIKLRMN